MRLFKRNISRSLLLAILLVFSMALPVFAASDDNSLSSLNVHNGTVEEEFVYSTWEYHVTVEPGTAELYLEPKTSDSNAEITSITGTVLVDGKATVLINTKSESGIPMTYTLHVKEAGQTESETETETEMETEPQTEADTVMQTEPETMVQSETAAEAAHMFQEQMGKLKQDSDLMVKILYGLIALTVILLFLIIHFILKKHDLNDEIKELKKRLEQQANEMAVKDRMMVTNQPYSQATLSQGEKSDQTVRTAPGGYQGMKPEDVPPNLPITEAVQVDTFADKNSAQALPAEAKDDKERDMPGEEAAGVNNTEDAKKEVNVTMVEL